MKSFGKKPFNKNKQITAKYNKFVIMNRRQQKKTKIQNNKKNLLTKTVTKNSLLEKVNHNILKTPNKTLLRKTRKKKEKKSSLSTKKKLKKHKSKT